MANGHRANRLACGGRDWRADSCSAPLHPVSHKRGEVVVIRPWARYVRWGWRRQAVVVFVVALVLRLGYVGVIGKLGARPPDYREQVRIASYILHGTGFVSPVGPERDDPSSWYVPG